MAGDEDHGGRNAFGRQPIPQLDPGHAGQLDVQYEAIEPGVPHIRAEFLGGGIGGRLHPGRAQEPRERAAKALVIIDDAHTEIGAMTNVHRNTG